MSCSLSNRNVGCAAFRTRCRPSWQNSLTINHKKRNVNTTERNFNRNRMQSHHRMIVQQKRLFTATERGRMNKTNYPYSIVSPTPKLQFAKLDPRSYITTENNLFLTDNYN